MSFVYVLQCEGNCWYVGSTTKSVEERIARHDIARNAPQWLLLYAKIAVSETFEVPEASRLVEENRKTLELMRKHGYRRVRGGVFCDVVEDDLIKVLKSNGFVDVISPDAPPPSCPPNSNGQKHVSKSKKHNQRQQERRDYRASIEKLIDAGQYDAARRLLHEALGQFPEGANLIALRDRLQT